MELIHAWMVVLTVGLSGLFVYIRRTNRERDELLKRLDQRFGQLDLREAVADVTRLIRARDIHADQRLREAVEALIARIEADPLTVDRYRFDLLKLKDQLR